MSLCGFAVNADIFFDNSLLRFGDFSTLDLEDNVLALSKWKDEGDGERSLYLRTDSQDAWIFRSPIRSEALPYLDFSMGQPRCDNRLAFVLRAVGHTVINPAFAIRATEVQGKVRAGSLYGQSGAVVGDGANVLLSDRHVF